MLDLIAGILIALILIGLVVAILMAIILFIFLMANMIIDIAREFIPNVKQIVKEVKK